MYPGVELAHQTHSNNKELRMNSNVNCGLWVVMVCQCQFINCNKSSPALKGDVDGGVTVCGGEQRVYGNSGYLLLNFAVNVQLL